MLPQVCPALNFSAAPADIFSMLWLEKRLVLLVTFLGLGLFQHWAGRGIESVSLAKPWKIALLMGYVVFSYTVAAELVTPYLQCAIKGMHGSLKPSRGALAGTITALVMVVLLYLGYSASYYPR